MSDREFDIIVYGATGFVGRRSVNYLAEAAAKTPIRWAIAARDEAKLKKLAQSVGNVETIVAEAQDVAAIDALVARTKVVLAMAGPFAKYSDKIVDACVRFGTHYADITGETPWIKTLVDRYHEKAQVDGTRIVPGCGFDSVPADIGAFFLARAMQLEFGADCDTINGFYRMSGGVNGGTLATLMMVSTDPAMKAGMRDPDLLTPKEGRTPATAARPDPAIASYDADAAAWVAPFVMGPINTRVVRRSAALFALWNERYSERFAYQEYMSFPGPFGAAFATAAAAATALAKGSAEFAPSRGLLEPLMPKPGTGPSESAIVNGWFRAEFFGRTADGRKMQAILKDSGDPGNAATVKCSCEAALALALQENDLPGAPGRGGVLTPATAIGAVLVARLRAAGMKFDLKTY